MSEKWHYEEKKTKGSRFKLSRKLLAVACILCFLGGLSGGLAVYWIYSSPTSDYTVTTWIVTITSNPSPGQINRYSIITLTATISGGTPSGTVTFQKSVNSGAWTDIGTAPVGTPTLAYNVTDTEGSIIRFRAGYPVS